MLFLKKLTGHQKPNQETPNNTNKINQKSKRVSPFLNCEIISKKRETKSTKKQAPKTPQAQHTASQLTKHSFKNQNKSSKAKKNIKHSIFFKCHIFGYLEYRDFSYNVYFAILATSTRVITNLVIDIFVTYKDLYFIYMDIRDLGTLCM